MVWSTLLQTVSAMVLAPGFTTADQIVVWGVLALLIGMIAWREYTMPEIPLPPQIPVQEPTPGTELPRR